MTAAGLVSTAADMARFSLALEDWPAPSTRPRTRAMFSPAVSSGGAELPYGLHRFIQDVDGRQLAWHYGWWVGASSLVDQGPRASPHFRPPRELGRTEPEVRPERRGDLLRSPFAREILAAWDAMDP